MLEEILENIMFATSFLSGILIGVGSVLYLLVMVIFAYRASTAFKNKRYIKSSFYILLNLIMTAIILIGDMLT